MKESELVVGAEYEGIGFSGAKRRGILTGIDADGANLKRTDVGDGQWYVEKSTLRRVEPVAEKPYVPKRGDRVRILEFDRLRSSCILNVGQEYECAKVADVQGAWVCLFPKTHISEYEQNGGWCRVEPVATAPIAEKDRLFDGEFVCALCGSEEWQPGTRFDGKLCEDFGFLDGKFKSKRRACSRCRDKYAQNSRGMDWCLVDNEIMRRKALVSGSSTPPAIDWASTCCQCGRDRPNHAETCSYFKAAPQSEPERSPADQLAWKLREETLAAEDAKRRKYEERCAAYAIVRMNESQSDLKTAEKNFWFQSQFTLHDAAKAGVKREEGPAYDMPQWPCDSGDNYEL